MKGILFSKPLFPLVINGSKTHTRRIIKPQPDDSGLHNHTDLPLSIDSKLKGFWGTVKDTGEDREFKPRYKVGEKVYLKEPYYNYGDGTVWYKFDEGMPKEISWSNKLFMPASIARYYIEITGVRCELLQDISYEDCIKEGIQKIVRIPCSDYMSQKVKETFYFSNGDDIEYESAIEAYHYLIDSINGKGTWDTNPFVWVYDFKIVELNK